MRKTRVTPLFRHIASLTILTLAMFMPGAAIAQPTDAFDVDRALESARHLAETIGDRPAGSEGEELAAGWLAGEFAELGYTVRIEPFTFYHDGEPVIGMNVSATRRGLPGYGVLYAGAHYDTVERLSNAPYGGPGANDNASGVAVLLELARIFSTAPLTPTLTLVAFGAEEHGLIGSRAYVRGLPAGARFLAQAMVNFDCVGVGSELQLYYKTENDRALAESLPVAPDRIRTSTSGSSDHVSFSDGGIPAVMFNMRSPAGACGPDYHQPTDTFDKLERAALERAGGAAAAAIEHLIESAAPREANFHYLPMIVAGAG